MGMNKVNKMAQNGIKVLTLGVRREEKNGEGKWDKEKRRGGGNFGCCSFNSGKL